MDYPTLAFLLLVLGLALLAAEVFIPSGGMIFILALVCLAGSIWSASRAWWTSNPTYFWIYLAVAAVLVPVSVGGAVFALQRTGLGRRILLEAPTLEEVTPYLQEQQHLQQMVGKTGKTITLLSPGGLVLVEGERFHCESPGMMIESGEAVDVIAIKGNRLVVRPAVHKPDEPAPAEPSTEPQVADKTPEPASDEQSPLDFDFPQS